MNFVQDKVNLYEVYDKKNLVPYYEEVEEKLL